MGVLATVAVVLVAVSAAKAQIPQDEREAYIDVGVATLWVESRTDRRIDKPALSDPSNVRVWQPSMSLKQKRWLVGRLQTQALYGQKVVILEESVNWVKVAVKEQPTPQHPLGYTG